MAAPVSRSTASWSSGRATPSKTELTGEEMGLCRDLNLDPEIFREKKTLMHKLKASEDIQN